MADLTVSKSHTGTAERLMQGANAPYDYNASVAGSLSFFVTRKFGDDWRVTASADTREEPVKNLFSNFLNKAPDSLFRRIDPAYYYPTYGDDSIVQELAPTLGKFYVQAEHHDDYGLWGNFRINYLDNELAQVDRGLYGGNVRWLSDTTTSFGEKRFAIDGFAAQPGTIAGRGEFRGTGGSLYFLHSQDILTGSERVRIELRDKDSGLVTGTVDLRPSIDYEIDYMQGRIVLAEPLSSTANDNLLVRTSALSGQEAYLVARYEYTPGFQDIRTWTTGGQGAPGLNALTATEYYGGTFKLPIGDRWSLNAKADRKAQDQGLETTAEELDVAYKLSKNWSVSTGVRRDDRQDNSPAVPATQQQGERTDVVAQLGYGSLATWRAYTFIQDTVSKSGDRDDNGRAGVGGSYRVTNKLQIEAEGSEGSLGPGGKLDRKS